MASFTQAGRRRTDGTDFIDILCADETTPETEILLSRKHYAVKHLRKKLREIYADMTGS